MNAACVPKNDALGSLPPHPIDAHRNDRTPTAVTIPNPTKNHGHTRFPLYVQPSGFNV